MIFTMRVLAHIRANLAPASTFAVERVFSPRVGVPNAAGACGTPCFITFHVLAFTVCLARYGFGRGAVFGLFNFVIFSLLASEAWPCYKVIHGRIWKNLTITEDVVSDRLDDIQSHTI